MMDGPGNASASARIGFNSRAASKPPSPLTAIDESASESRMSRISSPGKPKTYRTPSFSRHRTISSDAFIALRDPDRLDVHELADAVLGELAAIARALDAAERQARIRLHDAVHVDRPRVDLRRHALRRGAIPRPQRGAE